jgi:hypothetical protein
MARSSVGLLGERCGWQTISENPKQRARASMSRSTRNIGLATLGMLHLACCLILLRVYEMASFT